MLDLSQEIQDALEITITDLMHADTAFTSLDVANIVKNIGYRVRNREVANWLRSNAIRCAHGLGYPYNQTLITVDSKAAGITLAYCYHHFQIDADNYLDRDQNPTSFQQPTMVVGNPPFAANTGNQAAQAVAASTDPALFFDTREDARNFVRGRDDFKFKDNGAAHANTQSRWSAVPV